MVPSVFCTLPPLEMTRRLPAEAAPTTMTLDIDQRESVSVTVAVLLAPEVPMNVVVFFTRPPLEITILLPLPEKPRLMESEFDQVDPVPVTKTELLSLPPFCPRSEVVF